MSANLIQWDIALEMVLPWNFFTNELNELICEEPKIVEW